MSLVGTNQLTRRAYASRRKRGQVGTLAAPLAIALLMAACTADPSNADDTGGADPVSAGPVEIAVLHQGQCNETTQGWRVLGADEPHQKLIRSRLLMDHAASSRATGATSEQQVVAIFGGQQPTGAHSVQLQPDVLRGPGAEGAITLTADVVGPPPGLLATTVITYPCVIVALRGDAGAIQVADSAGAPWPRQR